MSQSKQRDSRKAKTSILFQVKHNTQQSIQFGQSFNIISLNTPSRIVQNQKRNPCSQSIAKTQQNVSINRTMAPKRAHQSGKLTLKMSSGNIILQDQNRGSSLHNTSSSATTAPTVYKKIQINQLVEKFQKKHMISFDKNKVTTDFQSFNLMLSELIEKINELQTQNIDFGSKIKKYQAYFKQLKIKQTPQVLDMILQPSSPSSQNIGKSSSASSQLKILNLQRKVETLNYIIKNYRTNNKQQVKQFEKKVNEYKPTLESQLLQMLTQSNKKYQQLNKIVTYFQKQYENVYKNGNWIQLTRSLNQKDQIIQKSTSKIKQYEQQAKKLQNISQNYKRIQEQLVCLNKEITDKKHEINQLKKKCIKLNQQKNCKQLQFYQLQRSQQELSYKYQALIPLQSKIKQKEEVIRKSSQTINRIQNQNFTLKNKIGALVKNSESQLFNQQPASIQTIQKCSTTIEELTSRFNQQLEGLPQISKQLSSFMSHLFERTKNSFQKIIEQYRYHLKQSVLQAKQLRSRLDSMINLNKRRYQVSQEIVEEINNIQIKRKRCQESHTKIQIKQECGSCLKWVLHWGQLNNLYTQQNILVKKLREVE